MKEEWALIDDNGGRRYKRVINGTSFRIREFNKDTFGLSYDCVIINRSYQDFESAEKDAIEIATGFSKFEKDMKALDMNIIHFPWKSITDWQNEWYKDVV